MKIVNNEPLVSVIMPVYNGENFVCQAIDSILNQTYQNFELLIADDGSKDKTWNIVNSYGSNKIKTFRFKKNIGAFPRTNFLIKHARGKYLAIMDSDDVSHCDRIKTQIDFLENNTDVIVVGSQVNIIDEEDKVIGKKVVPTQWQDIYHQFGIFHPMVHPSCVIRKSLLPKRKFIYWANYGVNSDYHTFFELLQYGKFVNLQETLLDYRIHSSNSSFKNLKHNFINSLTTRWEAITQFGYQIQPSHLFIIFCQSVLVFLAPTVLLARVYTTLRDIDNPTTGWLNIIAKIRAKFFDQLSGIKPVTEKSPSLAPISGALSPV